MDVSGKIVAPGLIDIHMHGAFGWDASAGPPGDSVLSKLACRCTTSFLPTLYPVAGRESRLSALGSYRKLSNKRLAGAQVLGIHMEGPFLNPELGAQLPEWCEIPANDGFDIYLRKFGDLIRMMTLSPELSGSEMLIRALRERGIVASVGHSAADKNSLKRARQRGLSHGTHVFNATKRPDPLFGGCISPDMNEFCLADESMTADIVVDGQSIHLDDILLKLAWLCKGPDRLILVSDSMTVAGLPPGTYDSKDGRRLVVDDTDVCRFEDGTICGSKMMLADALRNFMDRLNLPLEQALPTVTSNPARLLGLENRKGAIAPGMDADLLVLDESLNVHMAMVAGSIILEDR